MRTIKTHLVTASLVVLAALATVPAWRPTLMLSRRSMPSPCIPTAPASRASSRSTFPPATPRWWQRIFRWRWIRPRCGSRARRCEAHDRAIDTRPPRPVPPVNLTELDKRIEALKDERANWQGAIDAAGARRKFAERFAEASPAGLGDKGEARPLAEWRAAFAAVSEEVASADTAIRDAQRKQREIDREIARLNPTARSSRRPSSRSVIELAASAATKATLRVTYAVRNARWAPLYDARLDTGPRTASPRSNWCAAPKSPRARARTGRTSRWRSRRYEPRAAAARPN